VDRGPWVVVDAKGEPLRRVLETRHSAVVAKLNRAEFVETLGRAIEGEGELIEAMKELAPPEGGLIVTMGADGALCCVDGEVLRVRVPKVRAVNPIGSGDAFSAGLASRLWGDPVEAVRLGVACAVANAVTPLAGQVRVEDVARFREEVVVERVG
jgi:tagatose 6-phosphate kinase